MNVSALSVHTSPRFGAKPKPEEIEPFKALIKDQYGEKTLDRFDPNKADVIEWPAQKPAGFFKSIQNTLEARRFRQELERSLPKVLKAKWYESEVEVRHKFVDEVTSNPYFVWIKVPKNPIMVKGSAWKGDVILSTFEAAELRQNPEDLPILIRQAQNARESRIMFEHVKAAREALKKAEKDLALMKRKNELAALAALANIRKTVETLEAQATGDRNQGLLETLGQLKQDLETVASFEAIRKIKPPQEAS